MARPTYLPAKAYDIIANWDTGEISFYLSDNPDSGKDKTITLPEWLAREISKSITLAEEFGRQDAKEEIRRALGL